MHKKNIILNKILTRSFFLKNDFFLKIEDRNLFVKKEWVGFKLAVHNGKFFIPIVIKESMVGKLLGSLIFSKKILLKTKKKFRK